MLSKADVTAALLMMQQYNRFVEVTELAVSAWLELLSAAKITDAQLLKDAILAAHINTRRDVRPADILDHAAEIAEKRNYELEQEYEQKLFIKMAKATLARLGRTTAEYNDDEDLQRQLQEYLRGGWDYVSRLQFEGHWDEVQAEVEGDVAKPKLLAIPSTAPQNPGGDW